MLDEVVKINIRGYTSKRAEWLWSKAARQSTKPAHAIASGNVPQR
jgi:hypothetical protein